MLTEKISAISYTVAYVYLSYYAISAVFHIHIGG